MPGKIFNLVHSLQIGISISDASSYSRSISVSSSEIITSSLLSCMKTKSLRETQQAHAQLILTSLCSDTHLANLLLGSYFGCGKPVLAHGVLDQMSEKDSFSWAQVIAYYSKCKQPEKAIMFFNLMNRQGCNPNRSALVSTLNACSDLSRLRQGKQLHSQVVKRLSLSDVVVRNILVGFYSQCAEVSEARKAFDEICGKDLVSWTSLLSGYSQNGLCAEAWEIFRYMISQDLGFSHYAFSVAGKASAELKDLKAGEELHSLVIKAGFKWHIFVASSLVDLYCKHGKIKSALKIFDSMDEPNVVSWTSLITGHVQAGEEEEAMKLFKRQVQLGIAPDAFSLSSILSACASISALELGKQMHNWAIKSGFEMQIFAGNSLIGMYAKCGCLSDARNMHESMIERNVVTWTSMIAGYAQHGCGAEALEIFDNMKKAKVKPNSITLVAVLSACSRSGMVEKGIEYFESMQLDYKVEPSGEHYTCMVDLLARAGRIRDAEEFMRRMPFEPTASSWGALLSGCKACGDLKLGLKCAEELSKLEPKSAANHILLANMYAAEGRWEEMARIRGLMQVNGLKKENGYSWIEVGRAVYVFGVADNLNPDCYLVYNVLDLLAREMEEKVIMIT